MTSKEIAITCPHCATQLVVDVRTQSILRTNEPSESGKPETSRWDSAQSRVEERSSGAVDKLTEALEKERERRATFEDRFLDAERRATDEEEDEDTR